MPKERALAVVGAGCAGLYVAWRAAHAGVDCPIGVYERTPRFGGRLLTFGLPPRGHFEVGGMRFTPGQLLLTGLVRHLGLRTSSFDCGDTRLFLRGRHASMSGSGHVQWHGGEAEGPYALAQTERGAGPAQLVSWAIAQALRDLRIDPCPAWLNKLQRRLRGGWRLQDLSLDDAKWRLLKASATLKGGFLWEIGFWNVLQYYLSPEAVLFVHDALGYESIVANWNAGEAMPWFVRDFSTSEYLTLAKGMDALPTRLAEDVQDHGAELHMSHDLVALQSLGQGRGFFLRFRRSIGGTVSTIEVHAKQVVLALPARALRRLVIGGLSSDERRAWDAHLDSVMVQPLLKVLVAYRQPWWGKRPFRVITDLPLRQAYFAPPGSRNPSVGMVLASYTDSHYVGFWKPLLRRSPRSRPRLSSRTNGDLRLALRLIGLSANALRKTDRLLRTLVPSAGAEPSWGVGWDWSESPLRYDGGWHTWKAGVDAEATARAMVQPFEGLDLFVCGEAFSLEQGWVEGALRSAETVARRLGLGSPPWTLRSPNARRALASYLGLRLTTAAASLNY